MTIPQKEIRISAFDYELPEEKIAQSPLSNRQHSKLLVYKNGEIMDESFQNIEQYLPDNALLVFNNTKVIPARVFVTKPTGARIQVFLLQPEAPFQEVERALKLTSGPAVWQCMIGNAKRWKEGETLEMVHGDLHLKLTLKDKENRLVEFIWDSEMQFCDVLDEIGKMPLPPYIKRDEMESDAERYQTVYAKAEGAVAAPTAGLHFTNEILGSLESNGKQIAELTLHVGAGTFKPVEDDLVWNHPMHEEFYQLSVVQLEALLTDRPRIATGTTSLRTLETLYWVGIQIRDKVNNPFHVAQHLPYLYKGEAMSYNEALKFVIDYAHEHNLESVIGSSGIMIMPGYSIRSVVGIITNFHLPKSTLLLLISAMVGDAWRSIYDYAKANDYRFLSYGDSSLLFKS